MSKFSTELATTAIGKMEILRKELQRQYLISRGRVLARKQNKITLEEVYEREAFIYEQIHEEIAKICILLEQELSDDLSHFADLENQFQSLELSLQIAKGKAHDKNKDKNHP